MRHPHTRPHAPRTHRRRPLAVAAALAAAGLL
ncbi:hypothetical protein SMCF_1751, partial [Streptomyces coelicoflavus ZG0656]